MTGLDNSPPPSSVESSPREYDFEKKKGKIRGLWKNLGETGLRKNVNKRGITSLAEANRNDSMVNLRLFLENRSANITLDRTPSKSSILSRADFISPRKVSKNLFMNLLPPYLILITRTTFILYSMQFVVWKWNHQN